MTIFRHLRPLSTIFWKNPRLIREGIQIFQLKINLAPFTWYLGKTFVTSKPCFKNDNDKSKSLVNKNEIKITENKEIEEKVKSLTKKKHECPHCHKCLASKQSLQRHIDTVHLGLKPFKCDFCDKSFGEKGNLDKHISDVHLRLKPFKCDDCDKSFARKSDLNRHIASMHTEDLKLVE